MEITYIARNVVIESSYKGGGSMSKYGCRNRSTEDWNTRKPCGDI